MSRRELVCISCPIGCRLAVSWEQEERIEVKGNRCAKGEQYAREEVLAPRRVLTATVRLACGPLARLPVKSSAALPRERIPAVLRLAYALEVSPPVSLGQILLSNLEGTGVDLVATRSVSDPLATDLDVGKFTASDPER